MRFKASAGRKLLWLYGRGRGKDDSTIEVQIRRTKGRFSTILHSAVLLCRYLCGGSSLIQLLSLFFSENIYVIVVIVASVRRNLLNFKAPGGKI
jgi:hypothetical protein